MNTKSYHKVCSYAPETILIFDWAKTNQARPIFDKPK